MMVKPGILSKRPWEIFDRDLVLIEPQVGPAYWELTQLASA